MREQVRARESS